MPPNLALLSTLTGSNYPCLELIFMVPKVFELLKFDCNYDINSPRLQSLADQMPGLNANVRNWILGRN